MLARHFSFVALMIALGCAGGAVGFFGTTWWLSGHETETGAPLFNETHQFEFNNHSQDVQRLTGGWSGPENWGLWSDGNTAELVLPVTKEPLVSATLTFQVQGFVVPQLPQRDVQVSVGGRHKATWTFTTQTPNQTPSFGLSQGDLDAEGNAQIRFDIASVRSPKELGISEDTRNIGLGLTAVDLVSRYRKMTYQQE